MTCWAGLQQMKMDSIIARRVGNWNSGKMEDRARSIVEFSERYVQSLYALFPHKAAAWST